MFSDDQPITAVSVRKLDREASAVLRLVGEGERVVVMRFGRPVALIVSLEDGVGLLATPSAVALCEILADVRSDPGGAREGDPPNDARLTFTRSLSERARS